jgi:hypothetical protein
MDNAGEGIDLKALALHRTKYFGPQHSARSSAPVLVIAIDRN